MEQRKPVKHLTFDKRSIIEELLKLRHSIRRISDITGYSPSSISREIKTHAAKHVPRTCDCINYLHCTRKHICNPDGSCEKLCRNCSVAKKKCPDYSQAYCDDALENKTGVCNFCDKKHRCHFTYYLYDAKKAQKEANEALVNSRNGRNISAEHLAKVNEIVTPLLKKGQSVYHIVQEHGSELGLSESTLYRMIHDCSLDARAIDLRDAVKRKPRRKKKDNGYKNMTTVKESRKYEDYLAYIAENDVPTVQMDCVEGIKEDKAAILTLHFVIPHLQIAVIIDEQTAQEVVGALDKLEIALGYDLFCECFSLILTDNGHEFADIESMERSCTVPGKKRMMIFFCEPNRSDEKPNCENNHKYMRYIIPKGTSIEHLTQSDITLMMNHVNSFKRKSLGGKSPIQLARMFLPEDLFILLGLEEIPSDDVILRPELLKKS